MNEYSQRGTQNAWELFNHWNFLFRNVFERTFGVAKKLFPIITSVSEPHYNLNTITTIVLTCCILHNFLRGVDNDQSFIEEIDPWLLEHDLQTSSSQPREDDYNIGSHIRHSIAKTISKGYVNN